MAIKDLTESIKELSQEFDLEKLLGYEPNDYQSELFSELVIELIQKRTEDGKDINGKTFAKYSKEYAEKKGVSRSDVTLVDNQEMIEAIDHEVSGNFVRVFLDDPEQIGKAFGHQSGFEGHPYITGPERKWFGITTEETKELITLVDQEKTVEDKIFTADELAKIIEGM